MGHAKGQGGGVLASRHSWTTKGYCARHGLQTSPQCLQWGRVHLVPLVLLDEHRVLKQGGE